MEGGYNLDLVECGGFLSLAGQRAHKKVGERNKGPGGSIFRHPDTPLFFYVCSLELFVLLPSRGEGGGGADAPEPRRCVVWECTWQYLARAGDQTCA